MRKEKGYYEAAEQVLPFRELLLSVPRAVAETAVEIRIRSGRPIVVETRGASYLCGTRAAQPSELEACVQGFCRDSVQSCQRELSEGCITLRGGHRAGLSGTAGQSGSIREYTSVNLRIAREHIGIADDLFEKTAARGDFRGLLILGPPLSAKTTVLRDLCRRIASSKKTAVIDERGELAAVYHGIPQTEIGVNADVLTGFSKSEGIERAIRLLSPEYLICDEIGADYRSVLHCANRGVRPILTEHCGSAEEAGKNTAVRSLVRSGMVNYLALLGGRGELGQVKKIWRADDGASDPFRFDDPAVREDRFCDVRPAQKKNRAVSPFDLDARGNVGADEIPRGIDRRASENPLGAARFP